MKRVLLLLTLVTLTAAWSSTVSAATLHGIVVGKERGGLLVASPGGMVTAIRGHAAVGARVALSGVRLTIVGRSHTAAVRGIVVRHIGSMLFLSSNRHLLALHTGRRLADASPTQPAASPQPGDVVAAQVSIGANGQLVETQQANLGGSGSNTIQVQAPVTAVGAGTVTLNVQGQTLVVPLPSGLTLPTSLVGQTVTVSLELAGSNAGAGGDEDDDGGNSGHGGGGGDGGGDGGGGD